jgi:transcriptional regulator GlxA family with amidase domain
MKRFAIVALDGAMASSLANFADVIRVSNGFIAERVGQPARGNRLVDGKPVGCVCDVLSLDGRAVTCFGGTLVQPRYSLADPIDPYAAVFVPPFPQISPKDFIARLDSYQPLYSWLRRQWHAGAVIGSLGAGTMLLAEAGLLDDRLATTDRRMGEVFRQSYPSVRLDISQDITEQDRVYCAAALSLNTRLSLRLIERFLPSDLNNQLQKSMLSNSSFDVLPAGLRMPGEREKVLDVGDEIVARAQFWLQKNIAEKISMTDLAVSMHVSEKTLSRHFKKVIGITPNMYLQGIRIDSAKSMLLHSDIAIDVIAERVSYHSPEYFQQHFRKLVGITPALYRKRFLSASVDEKSATKNHVDK